MAQFISYDPNVEVASIYVFSVINSMRRDIEYRQSVLAKHGIKDPNPNLWYPLQDFFNAMKEIGDTTGEMNLFVMGLSAIKNTPIASGTTLRQVLEQTNIRLHSLHRLNGKVMYDATTGKFTPGIGEYKLLEYSDEERRAMMYSSSSYPEKVDEGVFVGRLQQFRPADSLSHEVKEDITKERKSQGADSSTYLLRW